MKLSHAAMVMTENKKMNPALTLPVPTVKMPEKSLGAPHSLPDPGPPGAAMDNRRFAAWKYDHGDKTRLTLRQRQIGCAGLLLVVPACLIAIPAGILLAIAAFIYLGIVWPKVGLILGPRTLQCGNRLVYFNQVTRVQLEAAAGEMTLYSGEREVFRLEMARFPTNARKTDKIARNKRAKFDRVAAKLAARIRAASPDVEMRGVTA